eukprot:scaffold277475_cov19-Prasinocladus_malaysianus.AAC.1
MPKHSAILQQKTFDLGLIHTYKKCGQLQNNIADSLLESMYEYLIKLSDAPCDEHKHNERKTCNDG